MSSSPLPLWVTLPGSVLLVLGGLATLVGSLGLLRFRDFFSRMHGPSMTNTMGAGAVLLTSMLALSAWTGRPTFHELLIALLLATGAPISTSLMIHAALYRDGVRRGA
jgi:multicomponent K+:H+ antiporter subunit G